MTFVVIDGWTVTVASVGDSRCILDTQGGVVSLLTVDHRLEENEEERERVTASGGEVGRLNVFGGSEVCIVYLFILVTSKNERKFTGKLFLQGFNFLMYSMVHRLVPYAAGLVGYAFLDQLVTQMWVNILSQYRMSSK